MPIFVTRQVQGASTKVESFIARGLSGQNSATVRQAQIYPLGRGSPGFMVEIANLQNLIQAKASGVSYYGKWGKTNDTLITVPTTFLEGRPLLMVKVGDVEKDNWIELGLRASAKKDILVGSPSTSQLKEIIAHGTNDLIPTEAGNVNVCGYVAFNWLSRGANAYMAVGGGDRGVYQQWIGSADVKSSYEAEKARLTGLSGEDKKKAVENYGRTSTLFANSVMASAARPPAFAWKDPAQFTPALSGHFFEYFPEMMEGDPEYAFNVFIDLFQAALGTTPQMIAERASYIRKGCRFLSNTQIGRQLQHVYFGMELSRKSGGLLEFFKEGVQYKGFVIVDGGAILDKGVLREPKAPNDLTADIRSAATHRAAVKEIVTQLGLLTDMAGNEVEVDVDRAVTSPRYLRNQIMKVNASSIEGIKDELKKHIALLRYSQVFWEITQENVVNFLRAMSSSASWNDEPLYVTLETMTSRNNIVNYLSVFGFQAPSIYDGNESRTIAAPSVDDPNLAEVAGKRVLQYIPVYSKGLMNAAADWASVANNRSLKFHGAKKKQAGKFADRSKDTLVISGAFFPTFYENLRSWVHESTGGKAKTQDKGKRRQDAMDVDGGGPSKKPKVVLL